MERWLTLGCGAVTVTLIGLMALNFFRNPVEARKAELNRQLAQIEPEQVDYATTVKVDFDALQSSIAGKRVLWQELVAPPPPPPPPPKQVEAPNMAEMLHGVIPSLRSKIGRGENMKIRIATPGNPRGEFMGLGDVVNGCTITKIEDESVEFSIDANGRTYNYSLLRK